MTDSTPAPAVDEATGRPRTTLALPKTDRVDRIKSDALDTCCGMVTWMLDEAFAICESPIERLFYAGFFPLQLVHNLRRPGRVIIQPQVSVLGYRADFVTAIVCQNTEQRRTCLHRIVVECDGHDYHERTKEQAARDKKRDREMQAAGYEVWRFTGSELHRNAVNCSRGVYRELLRMYDGCNESAVAASKESG